MYTLKVQPGNGTIYELTHDYNEFRITEIEGLDPPENTVNITAGLFDGGIFNSSRLQPRNIIIHGVFRGDIGTSRRKLYGLFPYKSPVSVFFDDGVRNLKTVGYVEKTDCSPFTFPAGFSVSLLCPDPFWNSVSQVTASLPYGSTVTFDNPGDIAAGFQLRVEFSAENPPSVTLGEASATLTASYPYQKNLMLYPVDGGVPVAADFDPETQKITELTLGGVDYTAMIANVEKITKQDDAVGTNATTMIRVKMTSNVFGLGNYAIGYTIASVEGGSMATVEINEYTSNWISDSYTMAYCNVNFYNARWHENYFADKDAYRVYLKNTAGIWEDVTNQCTLLGDAGAPPFVYAHFDYNIVSVGYREGKLIIYHDTNDADIRSTLQLRTFSGTRKPSTDWYANLYSLVPAGYDPEKNVPYLNGIRVTADAISDCYVVADETTTKYSIVYGDPSDSAAFRYVYSLSSADIRSYTDDQIDAGLLGVYFTRGLMLSDTTSGDWLYFKDTRFQTGDVLEISTVPGDIYAKITRREGAAANISLMWDAYKNGYFFELAPGSHNLQLSASSGGSYASGAISFYPLFTGV